MTSKVKHRTKSALPPKDGASNVTLNAPRIFNFHHIGNAIYFIFCTRALTLCTIIYFNAPHKPQYYVCYIPYFYIASNLPPNYNGDLATM